MGMAKKQIKKNLITGKAKLAAPPTAWFWVSALYKHIDSREKQTPRRKHLWERRVFVFQVQRGGERREARRVAKAAEIKQKNPDGGTVHWKLMEVEAYSELFDKRIRSGAEVYWTFFNRVDT
jgi:Domain of unknown function (DUF4288)